MPAYKYIDRIYLLFVIITITRSFRTKVIILFADRN